MEDKEGGADTGFGSSLAQILGIRGGEATTDLLRIRVQLMKPVTWVPLMWGELLHPFTHTKSLQRLIVVLYAYGAQWTSVSFPDLICRHTCTMGPNTNWPKACSSSKLASACESRSARASVLCTGVLCGAAASGGFHWNFVDVAKSATCMTMSGPLLTGYTQTINDYYDKEIDAVNEPNRPIPSGINHVMSAAWLHVGSLIPALAYVSLHANPACESLRIQAALLLAALEGSQGISAHVYCGLFHGAKCRGLEFIHLLHRWISLSCQAGLAFALWQRHDNMSELQNISLKLSLCRGHLRRPGRRTSLDSAAGRYCRRIWSGQMGRP